MSCPKYFCSKHSVGEGKVCASWADNGLYMHPCSGDNLVCVMPSGMEDDGVCTNNDKVPSSLPGDYCVNSNQCMYGSVCKGNVCKGKSENEHCTLDEHCDVEMYCKLGRCRSVGDSCKDNEKCASDKLCHNGVCVALFSLENGANATVPGVCKSYYASGGVCRPGPTLVDKETLACPKSRLCTYKTFNGSFSRPCSCSKTEEGSLYCPLEKGDFYIHRVTLSPT